MPFWFGGGEGFTEETSNVRLSAVWPKADAHASKKLPAIHGAFRIGLIDEQLLK
jgi:hypothetical protein